MKLGYSQNFLRNPDLIEKLLSYSLIKPDDTVLEIGAGQGIMGLIFLLLTNFWGTILFPFREWILYCLGLQN